MGFARYVISILFVQLLIISQNGCLCTISCFTCSSRNGSDVDCEDPFHPGNNTYTERCKVPKRGHKGEFPAHFCIKIIGTSYTTKERLLVRRCVMENMDSQCGNFRLGNDVLHGCILTCDLDGCNSSSNLSLSHILAVPTIFLLVSICFPFLSRSLESVTTHIQKKRQGLGVRHSDDYDEDEPKTFPSPENRSLSLAMRKSLFSDLEEIPILQGDSVQFYKSTFKCFNRMHQNKSRL